MEFFESCGNLSSGWAIFEILTMLLVSFILGYILRHFLGGKEVVTSDELPLSVDQNDLKVVEGIGPKIEELLKNDGIMTWSDLAQTDTDTLQTILTNAGNRFKMHDPRTWPEQAAMARDGQWSDLEDYQNSLVGGR